MILKVTNVNKSGEIFLKQGDLISLSSNGSNEITIYKRNLKERSGVFICNLCYCQTRFHMDDETTALEICGIVDLPLSKRLVNLTFNCE